MTTMTATGGATLISERMAKALSGQVGSEFAADIRYTLMGAYFEREGLPVLAGFCYKQADGERRHGRRIARYVTQAGGRLEIPIIEVQQATFTSAEESVRMALEHEVEVAGRFNQLTELAIQESDYLTKNFLEWFVNEQLEEVATLDELLKTIRRAGDNLLLVEDYLGRRGVLPAAAVAEGGAVQA